MKRTSSGLDEEKISHFLKTHSPDSGKIKFTNLICSLLNYFSLIPTLIYNVFWFFYLKSILEQIGVEDVSNITLLNNNKDIGGCLEVYSWANFALTYTIVSFLKAILLLGCIKVCLGEENDFNICCIVIKSLTSLIPSLYFVSKIPDYISNHNGHSVVENLVDLNPPSDITGGVICNNMKDILFIFYKCEYTYVIFIFSMLCFIPLGGILMGLKEYWKSRGYERHNKES